MKKLTMTLENDILHKCCYHVVWPVKYRRRALIGPIRPRLEELIQAQCAERKAILSRLFVHEQYVECIIEVSPVCGIHRMVREMKAITSRILREEFKELTTKLPTLWSRSYMVVSLGEKLDTEAIKDYLMSQKCSQRE